MINYKSWFKHTFLFMFLMSGSSAAMSQQSVSQPVHKSHPVSMKCGGDHSAHMKMMAKPDFSVTDVNYVIPDETLIDTSGKRTKLKKILEQGEPVALNFIFTTCTTICPVMTATFAQMKRALGPASEQINLVSITIDPEYDRPEILKAYATKFRAGDEWRFLTGDGNTINKVLRNFDVFAGSKMNHQPVTLFKKPGSPTWIRVDGLASGKEMASLVLKRLLN